LRREVNVGARCDPVEHAYWVFEGSSDKMAGGVSATPTGGIGLQMSPLCELPVNEGRDHDQQRHESEGANATSCATTVLVDVDLVPVRSTAGRQ
jgi:hypothetical protein